MLWRSLHFAIGVLILSTTIPRACAQSSFVYTANGRDGTISAYSIDPVAGTLNPVPGSPFSAQGSSTGWIATDPLGQFVFAVNETTSVDSNGSIAVFRIGVSGELTPVPGSPFPGGYHPDSAAIDPTGKFLYVSGWAAQSILGYSINRSTGALIPLSSSPPSGSAWPMKMHPSGRFLYAAFATYGAAYSLKAYSVNPATGALTYASDAPGTFASILDGLDIDPSGTFLYAAQRGVGYPGTALIHGFSVDAGTGALSSVPGSPYIFGDGGQSTYGDSPTKLHVDPTGRFLLVPDGGTHSTVFVYLIGSNGALTQTTASPFATGPIPGPYQIGTQPSDVTFDPLGRFAYVANNAIAVCGNTLCSTVAAFSIADSGALIPVLGSPFLSGPNPQSIASVTQIIPAQFGIAYVSPNFGGNLGTVTVRILGKSFQQRASVKLTVAGQPDILGTAISVSTSLFMTARFDLSGAAPGARDVVVTNPDGSSTSSPRAFNIQSGGASDTSISLIARNVMRGGQAQLLLMAVLNRGNIDSQPSRVWIAFPNYLDSEAPVQQPASSGQLNGTAYIAFDLPAVSPGESIAIPLLLTAPSSPIYAHQTFQIQAWKEGN
jgi:6-phosphogluconolactonase